MAVQFARAEVPVAETWNVEDIFPTPLAWEQELGELAGSVRSVAAYKGRLHEGPQVLLACLLALETLQTRAVKVFSYASLNLSADGTNPLYQAMAGKAGAAGAEAQAQTSFVQSEALGLPGGTLEKYLCDEPELGPFRMTIEKWLEKKPYMLGPETEMALAALGEVLGSPVEVYERSRTADLKFESVADSEGKLYPMSLGRHESAADLALRRNAYAELNRGLKQYLHTYGTTWGSEVKKNVVLAKLRGYASAIHMLVDQQEVNTEIYHNIHDVILTELAPHMRKYAQLRKKVLGLEKLLYCDIEAPLDPSFNPETTYEEACELLLASLKVLGPEYAQIMEDGLSNRWVDRADNLGKRTGAFCNSVYGVHPYISMSWGNRMRNALTLAHELGHAGQGVLAQRYQRLANTRPTMFFIEAPSTINELLVADHILANSKSKEMRRWLIMQLLMTYHHNFVRHLIEGELQRRTYALAEQGQPITATVLNKVQGEILEEFWGGEVVIDEGAKMVWMRQAHYYRGLYPYTYAAGLTVGTAVARAIQADGAPVAARWIEVLKAGGTLKPLELAKLAGVDMTIKKPIQDAVAYVGWLVDEVVKSF
ncbi:MAG: Oligoendopeptidase F, plasmid [Firmicutes bacterium]|nr:Oligoendopeptidase F, plasmid [candidate division NPL-UPA2 bacterium]